MNKYLFAIVLWAAVSSCKMNDLYLNVLQPAPVTLSPEIRKIGIINRSVPTDETKLVDIVDKILSLEGSDLDRDGAMESIAGLTEELKLNDRFSEVKSLKDIDFRASAVGVLPPQLSWDIVEKVCNETGMDALFALERFDTDTRLNYSTHNTEIKTPLGSIPGIEHDAAMETIIKTGWRIYDPALKTIPDEFNFAESLVFHAKGINPVAAAGSLLGRKDAVKQVSRNAGHSYAMRIIPFRLRVTREYFVKGTDNFKIARRKAQNGKWDEAGSLWETETGNSKSKIAGRASFNMAVINEINGNLEDALGWAQKAWEDYKIRPALEYARILEGRLYNKELLQIQAKR